MPISSSTSSSNNSSSDGGGGGGGGFHNKNRGGGVLLSFCPFSLAVFLGTAAYVTWQQRQRQQQRLLSDNNDSSNKSLSSSLQDISCCSCQVVFVLGGPGSGKGTQCQLLTERLIDPQTGRRQWAHLSAGDLLRAERQKKTGDSKLADLINARIAAGQLVPSEVTCQLIQNAMQQVYANEGITNFLIDGFPRSQGNVDAWNNANIRLSKHTTSSNKKNTTIINIPMVLFFECPEEVLVSRLMARAETSGRNDDTIQVIRKRFQTFQEQETPIVEYYEKQGLLCKIASDRSIEDIYQEVVSYFNHLK